MACSLIQTTLHLPLPRPQNPLLRCIPSVPAAASVRSFSSSVAAGEHWTAKYRLLLGIGDTPVVLRPKLEWDPPKPGVIKINYTTGVGELKAGSFAIKDRIDENAVTAWNSVCIISALARNAWGGVIGHTVGDVPSFLQRTRMGMHLYALRATGNLMQALRDERIHRGAFVIESNTDFEEIAKCFGGSGGCSDEDEDLLRDSIPDDLDHVNCNLKIHIGDPDEMNKYLGAASKDKEGFVMHQTKSGFVMDLPKNGADADGN